MTPIETNARWIRAYIVRADGPLDCIHCIAERAFIRATGQPPMAFATALAYARCKGWIVDSYAVARRLTAGKMEAAA